MTLTYKGYALSVWALCWIGAYIMLEVLAVISAKPVKTWGGDDAR